MRRALVSLVSVWVCGCGASGQSHPTDPGPSDTDLNAELQLELTAPSRPPLARRDFCVEPVAQPIGTWFDLAEALGVGTVGVNEVNWDRFEPEPPSGGQPSYDPVTWRLLGEVSQRAEAADLRLQLTVQVRSPWGTASTDSGIGAPGSSPVLPAYEADFQRWLRDVIDGTNGDEGLIVMLGNELEAPNHWNGTRRVPATGEAYTELVELGREVVDRSSPRPRLWRASTNFGPVFDDGPDASEIQERLSAGSSAQAEELLEAAFRGELAVDAFSLHPNYDPDGLWYQAQWLATRLPEGTPLVAEDMRSTRVDGLEPAWPDADQDGEADILEALTRGDPRARASWDRAQVATLSQKIGIAFAAGLEAACVSTLFDFPDTYAIADWRHTGLADRDGTPRPAFHAYRLWIAELQGWTPHQPIHTGEMWVVPWSKDGELAAMAWGEGEWAPAASWGPITRAVRPPTGASERAWTEVEVQSSISLDEVPIWVQFTRR